jgi:ubiquinone/menaquinone biosynthesis C-methylase UbiE
VVALLAGYLAAGQPSPVSRAARSVPQDDGAARDAWQRPEQVMDALGIVAGSAVADLGCGEGYFVLRLARRVGAGGTVQAEDVDESSLEKVRHRAEKEKLANVRAIRGRADDPQLPENALDAVLVVNAYHEFLEYDAMMKSILKALKPGGRLGIIDAAGDERRTRAEHQSKHTITEKLVMADAARNGLRFRSKEKGFHRPEGGSRHDFFFLIFERPAS